jgi:FAD/FMN-containing dehydrogenase
LFLPFNVTGIRRYQKASAVARLTLPITLAFVDGIADFINHVGVEDGSQTMISIEFFPHKKVLSVPRDATAFYQRGAWLDWHAMIGYGQRADLDGWVRDWAQRLTDKIVELGKEDDGIPEDLKTGGRNGYWFMGDDVGRKQLWGTNYDRLRALKGKYDPNSVFHSWFPITPTD